jgi:hypothetical protein
MRLTVDSILEPLRVLWRRTVSYPDLSSQAVEGSIATSATIGLKLKSMVNPTRWSAIDQRLCSLVSQHMDSDNSDTLVFLVMTCRPQSECPTRSLLQQLSVAIKVLILIQFVVPVVFQGSPMFHDYSS